jgi:hypothetical protein
LVLGSGGFKTHGELRTESVETPVLPPKFT